MPLSGPALDHAIVRIAMEFPENVGMDVDGKFVPGLSPRMLKGLVPAAPLKTGAPRAIDPAEIAVRWQQARDHLRRNGHRVTLKAMATELYISPETAKRYRRQFGLAL